MTFDMRRENEDGRMRLVLRPRELSGTMLQICRFPPPPAPFRSGRDVFVDGVESKRSRTNLSVEQDGTTRWKSSRVVSWCRRGTGFTHGKRSFGTSSPLLDRCEKLHQKGMLRDKAIIDNLPPYMSLTELLPQTNNIALSGGHMDHRQPLTHDELKRFIVRCQKDFQRCGATAHSLRIAVCVPNGPTLVTSLLATMHKHCCVPINPQTTVEETVTECLSTNVSVILYQRDTADMRRRLKAWWTS